MNVVKDVLAICNGQDIDIRDCSVCFIGGGCFGETYAVRTKDGKVTVTKIFKDRNEFMQKIESCRIKTYMTEEANVYDHIRTTMRNQGFQSPNICLWKDYGTLCNGRSGRRIYYAIMDYRGVGAATLHQKCKQTFSAQTFSASCCTTLDMMAWMHRNAIFHLDIKIDNITFCPLGNITVIDWGNTFIQSLQEHDALPNKPGDACQPTEYTHEPCLWAQSNRIRDKVGAIKDAVVKFKRAMRNNGTAEGVFLVGYTIEDYKDLDLYALITVLVGVANKMMPDKQERIELFKAMIRNIQSHQVWRSFQARSSAMEAFMSNTHREKHSDYQPNVLVDEILGSD